MYINAVLQLVVARLWGMLVLLGCWTTSCTHNTGICRWIDINRQEAVEVLQHGDDRGVLLLQLDLTDSVETASRVCPYSQG